MEAHRHRASKYIANYDLDSDQKKIQMILPASREAKIRMRIEFTNRKGLESLWCPRLRPLRHRFLSLFAQIGPATFSNVPFLTFLTRTLSPYLKKVQHLDSHLFSRLCSTSTSTLQMRCKKKVVSGCKKIEGSSDILL